MVHMVFAIMFFQYAARNWDQPDQARLNRKSNDHYHFALGYYSQLMASRTLQDLQAMALLCIHLRSFPKPGASWMVTNTAFTLAIELGLHRSATRWVQTTTPHNNALEIEMRKRVFYTILSIHVTLSGKLGRPMPIRLTDFDVELPEPVDDELLSEHGIDRTRPGRCSFLIGIEAFKATTIFLELFTNLYAVRRDPVRYIGNVTKLETQINDWRANWPIELVEPAVAAAAAAAADDADGDEREQRLFGLYLDLWVHEFRLLLRHPSISLTTLSVFNKENLSVCVESAHAMLQTLKVVRQYKSLDTTWYNGAVYLMAITTTLYAAWHRRHEMNAAELNGLHDEMAEWADIMGEIGAQMGMSPVHPLANSFPSRERAGRN